MTEECNVLITKAERLLETTDSKTLIRFEIIDGCSIVLVDTRSLDRQSFPLDPLALDALVETWPAFKAALPPDALVPTVPRGMRSPTASRAGPAATSSVSSPRSTSPASTTSGSGGPSSASGRASAAASPPAAQKGLFS